MRGLISQNCGLGLESDVCPGIEQLKGFVHKDTTCKTLKYI